jgi:hypothetical protein
MKPYVSSRTKPATKHSIPSGREGASRREIKRKGEGATKPNAFSRTKPATKLPFSRKRDRHCIRKRKGEQKREIDRKKERRGSTLRTRKNEQKRKRKTQIKREAVETPNAFSLKSAHSASIQRHSLRMRKRMQKRKGR